MSTRRRGDDAIAGGEGESRRAPVTAWSCRSGRFRPTALSPMGRRAGSVGARTSTSVQMRGGAESAGEARAAGSQNLGTALLQ